MTCDIDVSLHGHLAVLCISLFSCWSELGIVYSTAFFLDSFYCRLI